MTIYRGPGGTGSATSDADTTLYQDFLDQTKTARDSAVAAKDAAAVSASNAATSATNASSSASTATTSASSASTSAGVATTQASNAASSASAAATSAAASASSATAASGSATSASGSATTATTQASNASSSASAASSSASAASTSATNAASSATAAATSATNASSSASSSSTSASTATTQASNAASSASSASTSASNAATSATNAASSATAAAASAASIDPVTLVKLTGDQTVAGIKTFSSTIVGSVSGNAGTVTNGVYTTGTYSDPSWFTSLAGSKVSGNISGNAANVTGTVAVANGGTGATTASSARTNLGLVLGTDVLPVNNPTYTGTLTGGTGVVNLGSGQVYKDASGNLGIGTSSPSTKVHALTPSATPVAFRAANSASYAEFQVDSSGNSQLIAPGGVQIFNTNGAERARIDSSGNLGIGTTSPVSSLHIYKNTGAPFYSILENPATTGNASAGWQFNTYGGTGSVAQGYILATGNSWAYGALGANSMVLDGPGAGGLALVSENATAAIRFITGGVSTERMRLDSNGNLLVGTTGLFAGAGAKQSILWDPATQQGITFKSSNTTFNGSPIIFRNSVDGTSGFIAQSQTTVSYNTSSDYRLKENILPMQNALDLVAQLKPVTYTWKYDGSAGQGFIAHELQAVIPGCVTGEKDAVDADGNPRYQGIDTSFLVATLTAAIQEQQALIQTLTARVAQLESK